MNGKLLAWIIVVAMFVLASCSGTSNVTPPPTLPPNFELNQRALEANETAQAEHIKLLIAHGARIIEAQAFQAPNEIADDTPILPPSPRLSDRERRLVQAAIEHNGWFRVREITGAVGESNRFVLDVAQKWEVLGWLRQVQ